MQRRGGGGRLGESKGTRRVTWKYVTPVTEELATGRPFQSGLILSLPVCLFISTATGKVTPDVGDGFGEPDVIIPHFFFFFYIFFSFFSDFI